MLVFSVLMPAECIPTSTFEIPPHSAHYSFAKGHWIPTASSPSASTAPVCSAGRERHTMPVYPYVCPRQRADRLSIYIIRRGVVSFRSNTSTGIERRLGPELAQRSPGGGSGKNLHQNCIRRGAGFNLRDIEREIDHQYGQQESQRYWLSCCDRLLAR